MFPPENSEHIRWVQMGQYLSMFAEHGEEHGIRTTFAEIATSLVGLGAVDDPPGRRRAYMDTLGPEESPAMREAMCGMYSCGLAGRAILRLAGVRSPRLEAPYRSGAAVADISAIASMHGALRNGAVGAWPELGDLVCIGEAGPVRPKVQTPGAIDEYNRKRSRWLAEWGGEAHVFCVTDRNDVRYASVDGGQNDEKLGGMCILAKDRTYAVRGNRLWIGKRRLNFFVSVPRLQFDPDAQWVLPVVGPCAPSTRA